MLVHVRDNETVKSICQVSEQVTLKTSHNQDKMPPNRLTLRTSQFPGRHTFPYGWDDRAANIMGVYAVVSNTCPQVILSMGQFIFSTRCLGGNLSLIRCHDSRQVSSADRASEITENMIVMTQ